MRLSNKYLLSLYGIAPLLLLAAGVDRFFFHGYLLSHMPMRPDQLAYWTIIFVLPHVVASSLTFADKEYLKKYSSGLSAAAISSIILAIVIPYFVGIDISFIMMAAMTAWHMGAQMFGVSLFMLKRRPDRCFKLWKLTGQLGIVTGYVYLFAYKMIHHLLTIQFFYIAIIILATINLSLGIILLRSVKTRLARVNIICNSVAMLSMGILMFAHYSLFAIAVGRVLHDVTAFSFYYVHNYNRNREKSHNVLMRWLPMNVLSNIVMTMGIAMAVAFVLTFIKNQTIFFIFTIWFIIYFHYMTEKFMWKGGSLHRQHMSVV